MKAVEQFIKLDAEDVAHLEQQKLESQRGCFWFFAVIVCLLAAIPLWNTILIGVNREFFSKHLLLTIADIVAIAGGAFIIYKLARIFNTPTENTKVIKDLNEGCKKVVIRRVDEQQIASSTSKSSPFGSTKPIGNAPYRIDHTLASVTEVERINMEFILTLSGENYAVSEELYMKVKPGDAIETHLAPNSNHVFYHKLTASGEKFPPQSLRQAS